MEKLLYEIRPYFYCAVSFFGLTSPYNSHLMLSSGTLLLTMAVLIIHARMRNRGHIN